MDKHILIKPGVACEVCRQQAATQRVIISQPVDGKTKEERCSCCESCVAAFKRVIAKGTYPDLQIRQVTESEYIYHLSGKRN